MSRSGPLAVEEPHPHPAPAHPHPHLLIPRSVSSCHHPVAWQSSRPPAAHGRAVARPGPKSRAPPSTAPPGRPLFSGLGRWGDPQRLLAPSDQSQTRPVWDCHVGLPRNGQGWLTGSQLIGIYGSPLCRVWVFQKYTLEWFDGLGSGPPGSERL